MYKSLTQRDSATTRRRRIAVFFAVVFVFLLQSVYIILPSHPVYADTATVVINEIAPGDNGANKWIELYNVSDMAVDISGWRIMRGGDSFGAPISAGTSLASHSYYVIDSTDTLPLSSTSPVELWTDFPATGEKKDSILYSTVKNGQSYGRTGDGAAQFAILEVPSKGTANPLPDSTSPVLTVEEPDNAKVYDDKNGKITIKTLLQDDHGLARFHIDMDGNAPPDSTQPNDQDIIGQPATLTVITIYNAADFSEGQHIVHMSITDKSGNTTTATRVLYIDTINPDIVTTISDGQSVNGIVKLKAISTETNPATYHIAIVDDSGDVLTAGGQPLEDYSPQTTEGSFTYTWDSTQLPNGTYTVRFTIVDIAGHTAETTKQIVVNNPVVVGPGGGTTSEDLLLAQLSETLSQPFTVPSSLDPVPSPESVLSDADIKTAEASIAGRLKNPTNESNPPSTPVAATTGGWKVFGLFWYWWVLAGAGVSVVWMAMRKMVRRRKIDAGIMRTLDEQLDMDT